MNFEQLYDSMEKCKKGVMWKDSVAAFTLRSFKRIMPMIDKVNNLEYKTQPPYTFVVTSPKVREIVAVSFKDRVVQRALNDDIIYPIMTKSNIYDNAACQKGKGTDFARNRLKVFMQKAYRLWGRDFYTLKIDIKKYYPSMRHEYVEQMFKRRLDSWTYQTVIGILHEQYPGDVGYNAGSQLIQIAGISALSDLDHKIKERLKVKHYVRYMDDLIILSNSKYKLYKIMDSIVEELDKIGFKLNEKKTKIYSAKEGVEFLGFIFRCTGTGKILMLISSDTVRREKKHIVNVLNKVPIEQADEAFKSWKSHAMKGNTYNVIKRMTLYYKQRRKQVCQKLVEQGCQ